MQIGHKIYEVLKFPKANCIYKWKIIEVFSTFVAHYGLLTIKLKENFAYIWTVHLILLRTILSFTLRQYCFILKKSRTAKWEPLVDKALFFPHGVTYRSFGALGYWQCLMKQSENIEINTVEDKAIKTKL